MAVATVLELPELLESVLANLDMKTLLFAQRVNKQWQALISLSPKLQRSLYLAPTPCTEASYDGPTILNPLLTRVTKPLKREAVLVNPALDLPHLFDITVKPGDLVLQASALRMYLCQPPQTVESVVAAVFRQRGGDGFEEIDHIATSTNYNGQRLGDYYQAVKCFKNTSDFPSTRRAYAVVPVQGRGRIRYELKIGKWEEARWVFKG